MKTVVITGPTGAIGSALCSELLAQGVFVYAIVRPKSNRINNIPKSTNLKIIECELSNLQSLSNLEIKADAFFHLGWDKTTVLGRDDVNSQLKNIDYTLSAVDLANSLGCSVFIGAGSQAEYGVKDCALNGDTPVNPQSAYGIAKYTAGKLANIKCSSLGLRFCWCRILSVYGKNDGENTLISYLINSFKQNIAPSLTKCEQVWDYIYSEDIASALIAVAKKGVNGRVYCLGSGNPRTLKEYVIAVRDIVNKNCEINFGKKDYYPHQPMYLVADITDLVTDTGWQPKYSFEEGISRLLCDNN